MNYKYIALGGLIGFLFAVAPSCGSSKDCSPANCAGCCDSNKTCQTQSAATCGASGAACIACAAGQQCSGGVCTSGTGGGGGTSCHDQGKCTKQNGECGQPCSVGCCVPNDPFGTCSATINNQLCGKNGDTCAACSTGVSCTATTGGGQCGGGGDAGVNVVGKACATTADCAGLTNAVCKLQTATGNATYPGGFCTRLCDPQSTADDCGPSNWCVSGIAPYGDDDAFCWPQCNGAADCRTGYGCYLVSSNDQDPGGCWLKPLPQVDAGRPAPAGVPGKACTADTDCGPPPDYQPFCITDSLTDGGASGFVGGSCSNGCDVDPATCGPTGVCVNFGNSTTPLYICQQDCTTGFMTQSTCRQGYYCRQFSEADGGLANDGFCRRRCDNAFGAAGQTLGCPNGYACETTNGTCCPSDGGSCL
ncbi:MAG: hypothetical protein ACJ790_13470 [Myxococcaceae bacterium]